MYHIDTPRGKIEHCWIQLPDIYIQKPSNQRRDARRGCHALRDPGGSSNQLARFFGLMFNTPFVAEPHQENHRQVRRDHLVKAGRRIRLKKNLAPLMGLLQRGIDGHRFTSAEDLR